MTKPRAIDCKGEEFTFARATFRMWVPSSRIFVGQFVGHLPAETVPPLLAGLDRVIRDPAGALLFFEAHEVSGYEPACRTQIVRYMQGHRPQIANFRILVGSRLLAMGIEVANLALSGLIEPYSDAAEFARELDAVTSNTPMNSRVLSFVKRKAAT